MPGTLLCLGGQASGWLAQMVSDTNHRQMERTERGRGGHKGFRGELWASSGDPEAPAFSQGPVWWHICHHRFHCREVHLGLRKAGLALS